jgi:alginate O-acetyltransferase complex protein AlgI
MLLGGLWHGASWKFVIWGVLHGLALVVERFFKDKISLPKNGFVKLLTILATFHFVVLCWIFFRARDFITAFDIIGNIGRLQYQPNQWVTILEGYRNVFVVMLLGFLWHFLPESVTNYLGKTFGRLPLFLKALVLAFVYWLVFATATSGPQPFIYFQF